MGKYNINVDLEEGVLTEADIEKIIRLAVQGALFNEDILVNSISVKQSAVRPAGAPRAKGTAGRKPVNRPKVEAWIRANITAGPSTQGTMGLHGVDKEGKSVMKAANRIYPHRLADPVNGVGLGMPAINKALGELEVFGYLERGFAAGAPFYELIRPLPDGEVGMFGREEEPDEYDAGRLATPRVIDFTQDKTIPDDEADPLEQLRAGKSIDDIDID